MRNSFTLSHASTFIPRQYEYPDNLITLASADDQPILDERGKTLAYEPEVFNKMYFQANQAEVWRVRIEKIKQKLDQLGYGGVTVDDLRNKSLKFKTVAARRKEGFSKKQMQGMKLLDEEAEAREQRKKYLNSSDTSPAICRLAPGVLPDTFRPRIAATQFLKVAGRAAVGGGFGLGGGRAPTRGQRRHFRWNGRGRLERIPEPDVGESGEPVDVGESGVDDTFGAGEGAPPGGFRPPKKFNHVNPFLKKSATAFRALHSRHLQHRPIARSVFETLSPQPFEYALGPPPSRPAIVHVLAEENQIKKGAFREDWKGQRTYFRVHRVPPTTAGERETKTAAGILYDKASETGKRVRYYSAGFGGCEKNLATEDEARPKNSLGHSVNWVVQEEPNKEGLVKIKSVHNNEFAVDSNVWVQV